MRARQSTWPRSIAAVLVAILVAAAGCETIRENPKTSVGAGAGAAAGGLAGGLISRNTTGVVVGGLVGALAGGAIGYYLDRQDKNGAQAAAETGYTPAQGNVIRVDQLVARPDPVPVGETVNIVATYTLLTPRADQTTTVRETREIRHNGALVANPTTEFARPNGTFTSALPITLPATAGRGTYEVTTTVAAGDRVSRGTTSFTVR
jgi:outer membrane lipoprotein SlyB